MTSEFLLEAIGQMDDELVLEAAAPAKRYVPWKQVAGLAAAVLLCVGIAHMPGSPLEGAGAAAPENGAPQEESKHHLMADTAGGTDDYEYRTEQESQTREPSASQKAESAVTDGGMGIVEPQFFTERGVYLWVELSPRTSLPEGARELGTLTEYRYGERSYPAVRAKELVGCPVWESEDGDYLYVRVSDEGWLTARLIK